jgi:hypothetical protein
MRFVWYIRESRLVSILHAPRMVTQDLRRTTLLDFRAKAGRVGVRVRKVAAACSWLPLETTAIGLPSVVKAAG